jgi:hypothetical protein
MKIFCHRRGFYLLSLHRFHEPGRTLNASLLDKHMVSFSVAKFGASLVIFTLLPKRP